MINKEDYTILIDDIIIKKNDIRIKFRGKIDSLRASFLISEIQISDLNEKILSSYLNECSNYIIELTKSEALNILPKDLELFSLDEETIHEISYNPKKYMGINHLFNINSSMPKTVIILNKLRTEIRELEILCIDVIDYLDSKNENKEAYKHIQKNLNRLSSAVYVLMCLYASNKKSIEEINFNS